VKLLISAMTVFFHELQARSKRGRVPSANLLRQLPMDLAGCVRLRIPKNLAGRRELHIGLLLKRRGESGPFPWKNGGAGRGRGQHRRRRAVAMEGSGERRRERRGGGGARARGGSGVEGRRGSWLSGGRPSPAMARRSTERTAARKKPNPVERRGGGRERVAEAHQVFSPTVGVRYNDLIRLGWRLAAPWTARDHLHA
jgi:hypothetical protein